MCNPPYYSSAEEIEHSSQVKAVEPNSVCTGGENEMITDGGEEAFVKRMIDDSLSEDVKYRCLYAVRPQLLRVI